MNDVTHYEGARGAGKTTLMHKFPHLDTATLRSEADKLNGKIVAIQRSKDHHKHREALSAFQSVLHRMKLELKRRDGEDRRLRHAITPSQTA